MAAMRSALVMLGRRCCGSSGFSTAMSMVGGEVQQVSRTSAPLLRASARNLELHGLHRFSTGGMECTYQNKPLLMKHKDANVLQFWWQRNTAPSSISGDPYVKKYRSIRVFGTIIGLTLLCYMVMVPRSIQLQPVNRSHNTRISPLHSHRRKKRSAFCTLPRHHPWHRFCRRQ